jgi:hypothetical protein
MDNKVVQLRMPGNVRTWLLMYPVRRGQRRLVVEGQVFEGRIAATNEGDDRCVLIYRSIKKRLNGGLTNSRRCSKLSNAISGCGEKMHVSRNTRCATRL